MLNIKQDGLAPYPGVHLPDEVSTTADPSMKILCRYCKDGRHAHKIDGGWWHEVARGGDNGQYEPCAAGKLRNAPSAPPCPFKAGDRVRVIAGRFFRRTGTIKRVASSAVFREYVHVTFDIRPRERKAKTEMLEHAHLEALTDGGAS